MQNEFTEEQLKDYREAFNKFDKDESGTITTKELANAMQELG